MMTGNFNTKYKEWFASHTDKKEALLSEFARVSRPIPTNNSAEGHTDAAIASESLPCQVKGWVVLEEGSGSDHNYICITVERQIMVSALKKTGR